MFQLVIIFVKVAHRAHLRPRKLHSVDDDDPFEPICACSPCRSAARQPIRDRRHARAFRQASARPRHCRGGAAVPEPARLAGHGGNGKSTLRRQAALDDAPRTYHARIRRPVPGPLRATARPLLGSPLDKEMPGFENWPRPTSIDSPPRSRASTRYSLSPSFLSSSAEFGRHSRRRSPAPEQRFHKPGLGILPKNVEG